MREALQAGAEPAPFGSVVFVRPGLGGEQLGERGQLQQPGRDGRGGREAGQHQQQRAGLRPALGGQRVQGKVPGALDVRVDVRALFLDVRQRRGQLDPVQCLPVAGEAGPARERRPQVGTRQVQRQRQAAQAAGQLTRLVAAGIGHLRGQVPQHLGAGFVVQRLELTQRDPGAPDLRVPQPGGHDHHPGRVRPQPAGAVGRRGRVRARQHRGVVGALEHQQPAAAPDVVAVQELPGPGRRGPRALPHRHRHRFRRAELAQHLEHPAGQQRRVRRPHPPHAVAALLGHPGRGQRDGGLAKPAHAGDHERPAGPPRVGSQRPAQLADQPVAAAHVGRQLAERRRDRQRARDAFPRRRGHQAQARQRGHPPGQVHPRRYQHLLDLALHVLEDRRIHPPGAVPHHVVVDVVGRREDQVRLLGGEPGLDHRSVDDARRGDHRLPGKPLGVAPDRPDVQRDPQLDPYYLAGPAVVLAQPVRQLGRQRVDHAVRGDRRRHHDDGAVAAVLAVAGLPRHPRRIERGPQDLVHRRAHHVAVAVVAHRI